MKLTKILDEEMNVILGKNIHVKKNILVLSGGGMKAIAQIGALQVLEEEGILNDISTIAGTSAGAILGCLLLIGYTPLQLKDFVMLFDVKKMKANVNSNIFCEYGLDTGQNIMQVIKTMFRNKKFDQEITFGDMFKKTGKKIIMTATCLNDKDIHYFSVDTHPDMKVLDILRITISFPIYFTPIILDGKLYVDGGCIDNYPIQLFKSSLDNVIGIHVSSNKQCVKQIKNVEDFLLSLIHCLVEGIKFNSIKGFEKQTININCSHKDMLNINISPEEKIQLYEEGYNCAKNYFSSNLL